MNIELDEKEIATILAALRLFKTEAMKMNMAQAFPDHFAEISPLSIEEIDYLCGCINENVRLYHNSSKFAWKQLIKEVNAEINTPLNQLILKLAYAVENEILCYDNAFNILDGQDWWIQDISQSEIYAAIYSAFNEREKLYKSVEWGEFSIEAYKSTTYITKDFVRNDCKINGAILSDFDCDRVIAEVQELAQQGNFTHTGIYHIANRLAGSKCIHPQ